VKGAVFKSFGTQKEAEGFMGTTSFAKTTTKKKRTLTNSTLRKPKVTVDNTAISFQLKAPTVDQMWNKNKDFLHSALVVDKEYFLSHWPDTVP